MLATSSETSISSGLSGWRRANASSWAVRTAAFSAAWTIALAKRLRRSSARPGAAEDVGRALDHSQQIVEIVGDAAGQLAERLHLLALAELLLRLRAHLHLLGEQLVRLTQCLGAVAELAVSATERRLCKS